VPRYARLAAPGVIHHVIARFVNRAYRLSGPPERQEYLARLRRQLGGCDWHLLAYALMSSHIHLVLVAGNDLSSRLIGPLHTGFALWLNKRQGRLGPVFAARHTTIAFDDSQLLTLLAYVHNNPVRAGVVSIAGASDWTSHPAYVGEVATPPWLRVREGLQRAGLRGPQAGEAFDELVRARAGVPRDPQLSSDPKVERVAIRRATNAPIEVGSAHVAGDGRSVQVLRAGELRPRWPGTAAQVVELVARQNRVSNARILGPDRDRDSVPATPVALHAWPAPGRHRAARAGHLHRSEAGASHLLRRDREAVEALRADGALVASICWEEHWAAEGLKARKS